MINYLNINFITRTVETMLPIFSNKELGLLFRLMIRGEKSERTDHQRIEYLFFRPSNYTKVFVRFPNIDENLLPIYTQFYLKSDHDSCWKSEGLTDIFNILCGMRDYLDPNAPFSQCNFNIDFFFVEKPKYYFCEYPDSLTDKQRYSKEPVDIIFKKQLPIKQASNYMK